MGWSYSSTGYPSTNSSMIPSWAFASILGVESYAETNTYLLPNEIYAFFTASRATIEDTDIGTSLMCPDTSIGIVVGGRDRARSVVTVLTVAPYKNFIDYIIYEGVTEIGKREFRDVISIWKSDNFLCGGFMVDDYHIVTAAQCMNGVKAVDLRVVSAQTSEISLVENITVGNDIAVLKLTSDLPWNPLISVKDLPDSSEISFDRPCQLLRWTQTTSRHTVSRKLMQSAVKIFNRNERSDFHTRAEKFWAGSFYALPIATQNDIGNPILFDNSIIGMVVAVDLTPSAITAPVICLKILPYQNFIRSVVENTNVS